MEESDVKFCERCRQYKHKYSFAKFKGEEFYKDCWEKNRKNTYYKYKYNITIEEYERKFKEQRGICSICHNIFDSNLVVDHNHFNNKVRGLLCNTCNLALGLIKEDLKTLQRMQEYIISWNVIHKTE